MLQIHVIWQTDLKPLSVTNAKNGEQSPFLAYRGYKQVMQGVTKQVRWWGGVYSVGEVSWGSCGCIRKKHVKTSHHTVGNHNFQKMDVCSHRNIVSSHHQHLITPKKICSHHQFTRSHRHNFVHTMHILITLLKLLFTPSKFCSHHQFSNRHNFDHTIKMLITLLKSCFTPSKF